MHTPPVKPPEWSLVEATSFGRIRVWIPRGGLSRNKVPVAEAAGGSPPVQYIKNPLGLLSTITIELIFHWALLRSPLLNKPLLSYCRVKLFKGEAENRAASRARSSVRKSTRFAGETPRVQIPSGPSSFFLCKKNLVEKKPTFSLLRNCSMKFIEK